MDLDPALPVPSELLAMAYGRLDAALRRWLPGRRQHHDREDVLQEAMLLLSLRWPQIVSHARERARSEEGVVNQMVAYVAMTAAYAFRREAVQNKELAADPDTFAEHAGTACGPTQGAAADLAELLPKFYAFLESLPETDRLALEAFLREQSHDEIAQAQGISENASCLRRRNALLRLGKRGESFRRLGEDLLAAQRGARHGHYGGTAGPEIAVMVEGESGSAETTIPAQGLRWHADGFLRAQLVLPETLAQPAIGVVLVQVAGEWSLPSAPFVLASRADLRTPLTAYLGKPPHRDRNPDGGMSLPAEWVRLALAV